MSMIHIGATRKSQKATLDGIITILQSAPLRGDDVIVKALDVFGQSAVAKNISISHSTFTQECSCEEDYDRPE